MNLSAIQAALREREIDAWLFYDHHHRDAIAYRLLGIPQSLMVTRRWFYCIPAQGDPAKLVHRIEAGHLDSLPGKKTEYSAWQELQDSLRAMLKPYRRVAMQYSPNNAVFLIGLVDAGTVEMVRSFGHDIQSSGNLVAEFEATWTEEQIRSHFEARDCIDRITEEAFKEIGRRVRGAANGAGTHEFEIQQWIMEAFRRDGLTPGDDLPIVAVNQNSGNPHYEPRAEKSAPIRPGDFVLLDIWGKTSASNAVFYDVTWTGFVGSAPSDRQREVFEIVRRARDVGVETVRSGIGAGRTMAGWEVDQAVREFINKSGYGKFFVHRTGHSISTTVHGNGANMDNFETHDER
ncbi:MAG TPA: M24 family metallopeptidase, partial [Terriglobales bacterium]|nr:M24 family metallopeptidase [Terriglobales bacterium]